jgi:hypothetical protein
VSVELQGPKTLGNPSWTSSVTQTFQKGELTMPARVTLAKLAVLLTAVAIQSVASAQDFSGPATASSQLSQTVNRVKSKVPSDARASQATSPGRPYYRALDGAYGAAPGNFSQNRVYAPNHYQPGQVFGAGVDPDFQMQRSD